MLGIAARAGEVDASDPPSTVLLPRLSSSMDDAPAPVTSLYVLLSEPSLLQAHSALQGERLRHLCVDLLRRRAGRGLRRYECCWEGDGLH